LEQRRNRDDWLITVLWDGAERTELIAVAEPKDWNPETGSTSAAEFSQSTELPSDAPVTLFRRRFMRTNDKGQYSDTNEGTLLWIERMSETNAKP